MTPNHVEESEHGMTCKSCGGIVGEDGLAETMGEAEEFEPVEGADTDQHEAGERMRDSAFADALRRRKGER